MLHIARLTDRAVLAVSGPEARGFLQGLVTNDVEALRPGGALYAAMLTPQGKIMFDFLIFERDGGFLLDVTASQREALRKRLTLYRLRAKVEITPRDDLAVVAGWGDGVTGSDPRHPQLGMRAIEDADTAKGGGDYLAHRLGLGVPESADFGQDRMFALDADLDELHGVAFDKGCYVGQELTARMKHRGTARKRLLPVETLNSAPLPAADTAVTAGEREIGNIVSVYGPRGFAVIRLDRLEQAGDAETGAGDVPVRIVKPSWLFPSPTA